jgi:hypothetical protein
VHVWFCRKNGERENKSKRKQQESEETRVRDKLTAGSQNIAAQASGMDVCCLDCKLLIYFFLK